MPCAQCGDDPHVCDVCGKPSPFVPQNARGYRDWLPVLWWVPDCEPPAGAVFTDDELADVLAVIDRMAIAASAPTAEELEAAAETDAGFSAYEADLADELTAYVELFTYEDRWVDSPPPGWEEWRD